MHALFNVPGFILTSPLLQLRIGSFGASVAVEEEGLHFPAATYTATQVSATRVGPLVQQ